MRSIGRFLIAFLAVTGAVALATGQFQVEFGHSSYWNHHGFFFLIFVTLFPRLTLLFSSVPTGGLLWWLAWLVAPRLLVAVLATFAYWHHDPILVVIAWLVALGGESSEKYVVVQRSHPRARGERQVPEERPPEGRVHGYDSAKWVDSETKDPHSGER